ncbi:hypothetical protein OsI_15472 [Oryza sativa Indica Group]|uniref:Receptor kinase-like protein Xa21 n=1 Tax=Oryza sativa subsp. indica TaxID=39946 RepID=B8ASJ8_ORYSI|nr:hypothetical protein OsI_15472 [Oryza sativa Indica Group]
MFIQLVLLLLCYGVGNNVVVHCSTVRENNTDLQSLIDFKNGITEDPGGVLLSWNTSTHFCRWNGVICTTTRPWRVSGLNLTDRSLAGKITSSLANLTSLSILDLSSNRFFGQVPLLNHLKQLDTLNLSINALEGTIPNELINCSNLRALDISGNFLHGAIPANIGSLINLEHLDLAANNLTGIIPVSVQNLTKVNLIRLKQNHLEGSIPDRIWQLPNLSFLLIGDNMLSGEIPSTLNFSRIEILSLETNSLSKVLPPNFGDAFLHLQIVTLSQNNFEGQIPPSVGNASALLTIDFANNNFTGQIPTSFGRLSNLSVLSLQFNMLEANENQGWEFLYALRNCTSLTVLALAYNNLQGSLPDSVGNLSINLQHLILVGNNISGTVPPSIGNFPNLIRLSLSSNSFCGEIGEWIGNLKNLQGLFLRENNFIGPITPSIGNLTQLTELFLQNNKFEGLMPPSIGHLTQLSVLDLSCNNLQGNIHLGDGNLKQLVELHLSSNKFSGEIPDALGQSQNLVVIQLGQNILTGDIPVYFGNLKSLNVLNLSYNSLSRTIPTALSGLQLLSKLDLSHNHLHGEIPRNGIFENVTAVSLDGNWRLCGGAVDFHMPLCASISQKIERKPNLVRLLIPIFGFMSLTMLIYVTTLGKKTSRRTYLFMFSFGKQFPKVSYSDLAQATGNFSELNLIGRGSYGSVYKGKLTQAKIEVAIKVFNLEMRRANGSFVSECEVLRTIRHRNLLPVLTACSTIDNGGKDFKALIYEFMHNGNLDKWLHHGHAGVVRKHLSMDQRVSIAVNIADALVYLHHDCGRPIVHCDVKPTNILLDEDMSAHLGDFGIASLVLDSSLTSDGNSGCNSSIVVKGTMGYIAPEYAQSVRASTSGDVYSFGVVLMEMLIGKRPTDSMFENELTITKFVERNFPDHILHIIDVHLQEECKGFMHATSKTENAAYQCLVSLAQLALSLLELLLLLHGVGGIRCSTVPENSTDMLSLLTLRKAINDPAGALRNWDTRAPHCQWNGVRCTMKHHGRVTALNLAGQGLSGTIHASLGNLTFVRTLDLSSNNFSGQMPDLSNLQKMQVLNLSYNSLDGIITDTLTNCSNLKELHLYHNSLRGTIPWEISNLRQLVYLKLASNKLTGNVPNALDRCQNLVTIEMDQNFLTGTIPISLGNLKGLTVLNLSHNILSGTIPTLLGDLPLLSKLDLSYNNLQGEIPRNGLFRNATSVYLEGNRGLCGGVMDLHMPSCHQVSHRIERKRNWARLLIPIFGFLSLTVLICLIYLVKKTTRRTYLSLLSFGKQLPRVSYKDIAQATGNFSRLNLIGRGSYSSVYRAKLSPVKIQVAIKVFDLEMRCADKSFVSECEILRNIRHRNLLPILTACSTIDYSGNAFKALIYEYMPNGNLDMWLHKKNTNVASKCLSLSQKINIAVDIANALSYLHHECERSIVHCDLKPTNILLDNDMNAYLGDFGISSLILESRFALPGQSSPNSSIGLKGTIGYIAPEYAQCGHSSTCGDVYSFGIVLLEMLIGKRPTDPMFENELNIVNFVEKNFPEQILQIIDVRLQEEYKGINQAMTKKENCFYVCLLSVVQVALSCTPMIPKERMNMREIDIKLHAIRASYAEATNREHLLCRRELQCVMEVV